MASVMPDRRQVNVQALFDALLVEAYTRLMAALAARMSRLLERAVDQLL